MRLPDSATRVVIHEGLIVISRVDVPISVLVLAQSRSIKCNEITQIKIKLCRKS